MNLRGTGGSAIALVSSKSIANVEMSPDRFHALELFHADGVTPVFVVLEYKQWNRRLEARKRPLFRDKISEFRATEGR